MASPWLSRHTVAVACIVFAALHALWTGLALPVPLLDPLTIGPLQLPALSGPRQLVGLGVGIALWTACYLSAALADAVGDLRYFTHAYPALSDRRGLPAFDLLLLALVLLGGSWLLHAHPTHLDWRFGGPAIVTLLALAAIWTGRHG